MAKNNADIHDVPDKVMLSVLKQLAPLQAYTIRRLYERHKNDDNPYQLARDILAILGEEL